MGNTEIKASLKYTDEDGKAQIFVEGDNVICCTENEGRYVGEIVGIGMYQENEDAEAEMIIGIADTSKSATSYPVDAVKVADITYICKNPIGNLLGYPKVDEEQDFENFTNMIIGLGRDGETAENLYDSMKSFTSFYKVPLSSVLVSAIQEAGQNVKEASKEEFRDIMYRSMGILVDTFKMLTDMISESYEREKKEDLK